MTPAINPDTHQRPPSETDDFEETVSPSESRCSITSYTWAPFPTRQSTICEGSTLVEVTER